MNELIVGHSSQRHLLSEMLGEGKLPASLLFCGPAGIGKELVARELARSLLCEEGLTSAYGGCGSCTSCHVFDAGNHPDFYPIDCSDKERSSIAAVRDTLYSLHLKPFQSSRRVTIFSNAEMLSSPVANVLLKTLEEPPTDTYFILVSANPARLPRTVLSRCHQWSFDRLSERDLRTIVSRLIETSNGEWLQSITNDPDWAILADGSMESLYQVGASLDHWRHLKLNVSRISEGDVRCAIELAQSIGKDKENIRLSLMLLRVLARARLHQSQSQDEFAQSSTFLSNVLKAELLVVERNLNPTYTFGAVLLSLLPDAVTGSFTRTTNSDTLISSFVV